ncbi:MAG: sulfatase [Deltaproteobacteria bacterium]|nr:sulfatase [Deltaproteobacteria bacterium]
MKFFERLSEYKNKFTIAILLAAAIGFVFGVLKSIAFIISNKYLQHKMYYLTVYWFTSIINKYLLVALVVAVLVLIVLILIKTLVEFIGVNRKNRDVIIQGLVPAFLLFIGGGYWINKLYLPGSYELKSIIGNAVWVFTCVIIGWLIFKISQTRFVSFLRIYNLRILVTIICLVVGLNAARYLYFRLLESDRPNVILISIDTLRADHLSSYGYNRETSPNIDHFAEDGVLFKNTFAQSSWTLPSHMSILTGLYSSSHGVIVDRTKLANEHVTIAEVLQNAGYETAAITDGGYLSPRYGYQGFYFFDTNDTGCKERRIESTYDISIEWLRKKHARPFFLFLHTYQVHAPFDPPPNFDIYSDQNYNGIVEVSGSNNHYYKEIEHKMNTEDVLHVIDKYDGGILYMDDYLGKLFKELEDLGLYDRSIIVFTSDHGEHFLDHPDSRVSFIGHFEHQLYDEIVKVPLIIKAQGFPKKQVIDAQVESIDIVPTVLELLGITIPHGIDGVSLVEKVMVTNIE